MSTPHIAYLETRAELLHLQLARIQAAAAIVCVKANLRKSTVQDFQRLADAVRAADWSAEAERLFREGYNAPEAKPPRVEKILR